MKKFDALNYEFTQHLTLREKNIELQGEAGIDLENKSNPMAYAASNILMSVIGAKPVVAPKDDLKNWVVAYIKECNKVNGFYEEEFDNLQSRFENL